MSDHRDGIIINAAIKQYFKSLELDGEFIIFRDNGDDIKIDAELNITDLVATIESRIRARKTSESASTTTNPSVSKEAILSDHRDGIITDMQKRAQGKGAEIEALQSAMRAKDERIEALEHEILLRDREVELVSLRFSKASLEDHIKAWWRGRW